MKQSDFNFRQDVPFSSMLEMARKLVETMFGDPDGRLNMALGAEYLYMQAATRLFTDYQEDGSIEEFMNMIFSVGVERYENWLRDNAGAEKYDAFKRMVERGSKLFMDITPLESLASELGRAVHYLNKMIEEAGGLSPDNAAAEVEEQKETPPQD